MGLRETLNENPNYTTAAAGAVVFISLGFIVWRVLSSGGASGSSGVASSGGAYFTSDDGATYFADNADNLSPEQHDGKTAYLCYVFKCAGQKPFVQYLERLPPQAMRKVLAARAASSKGSGPPAAEAQITGIVAGSTEVKPPLTPDTAWINRNSPRASQIMTPNCPDAEIVTP